MPDGGRCEVFNVADLAGREYNGWRVRSATGDGWVYGEVSFGGDDAVFAPAVEQPASAGRARQRRDGCDMEADMFASPEVRAAVADDGLAQALYAAMCNRDWRLGDSDERWSCSWRAAGGIVADLRGRGEIYADWYCSGIGGDVEDGVGSTPAMPEGTVRADVRALLAGLGWRPVDDDDVAADHAAAVARILELEAAAAGNPAREAPPASDGPSKGPPRRGGRPSWSDRLRALEERGGVDHGEGRRLFDRLDLRRDGEGT